MNAINIKAVLTGDVVQSTQIGLPDRDILLSTIKKICDDVCKLSDVELEIYRGDSFQIVVDNPFMAVRISFLLRAGLIMNTPADSDIKWDARISLGLGSIDYYKRDSVAQSDGEAFRNSGRELDDMAKNSRLALKSSWPDFDKDISIGLTFSDNIIGEWTITQAKIIYKSLLDNLIQKELAGIMDITPQAASKLMIGGKYELIERFLNYYSYKLECKIN